GRDEGSFNSSHVFRRRFSAVRESRIQGFQHLVVFERDWTEAGSVIREISRFGQVTPTEYSVPIELIVDNGSPHNCCVKGDRRVISDDDSRLRYHILDIDLRVGA